MGRTLIDEYLLLMDAAFRRPRSRDGDTHSVLGNLKSAPEAAWDWVPPGGKRTIREIVFHIGWAKYMYDDHAFRGGTMTGGEPPALGEVNNDTSLADVIVWLGRSQLLLMESIGRLEDEDLPGPRKSNWGSTQTARWVIQAMLEHDLYHAGEINHIRSLFQQSDGWAYEL